MNVRLAVSCLAIGAMQVGCDQVFGLEPLATKLVFDNAASQTDLVGFPVLVAPDPSVLDTTSVEDELADLRFEDASTGAVLPHEVSRWGPDGVEIWVLVPRIAAGSTTDHVLMSVGANIGAGGPLPSEVWAGHEVVLHLDQTSPVVDASRNVMADAFRATLVGGQVGGGLRFTANSDVELLATESLLGGRNQFTLALWVRPDYVVTGVPQEVVLQDGPLPSVRLTGAVAEVAIEAEWRFATSTELLVADLPNHAWSSLTFSDDGTRLRLFREGVEVDSAATTQLLAAATSNFFLGGSNTFRGELDEVWVSSVDRSADWIAAQYRSMTRTFVTFE